MARPQRELRESTNTLESQIESLQRDLSALQREVASIRGVRPRNPDAEGWFTPVVMSALALGLCAGLWRTYALHRARPTPTAPAAVVNNDYNPPPGSAPAPSPAPSRAPTPSPAPEGGGGPSSDQVATALRSIFPTASACTHGAHGITVALSFLPSGSVGTVTVTGTADATVRDCITTASRAATVPAFRGAPREANFAL